MARTVDPVKHQARRRHIMNAAVELFASQGFQATTVAQICNAAQIGTGNLFHYFPSKRDLFVAIVTNEGDDGTATALAAARDAEDPMAGLLGFVDHLAAGAAEPGVPGLVLEAMIQASRDPLIAQRMGNDAATEESGVAELLERAARAGAIDPELDVEAAAAWIMAIVGALYLQGATDEGFVAARHLPMLRRTVRRFVQA